MEGDILCKDMAKLVELKNLNEADNFITLNTYLCIEINGHLLTNIIYNVVVGS